MASAKKKPGAALPATKATAEQITAQIEEARREMRPADAKRFDEVMLRYDNHPFPISAKLENTNGRQWDVTHNGNDIVGRIRTLAAFGTMSQPFIDTIMGELLTIWDANGGISAKSYNAALAVIEAAAPTNELEAMLVVQMIAANEAALRSTSMIGKNPDPQVAQGFGNLANKFMRTFTAQTEALAKLRRGGEQVIKYLHVHEGGQAVVAETINQHGGRVNFEREQPYGTGGAAECPALPCPHPEGNGVPVPRDAERAMPNPRREESRGADRQ